MTQIENDCPDVLIVGAGPAGLAAALELRKQGVNQVFVLERECVAGGIPRHCFHTGFGLFDRRRILSGPKYASEYEALVRKSGANIFTHTTAVGWEHSNQIRVSSPDGVRMLKANAILLATGCRERPRSARLVPGKRPEGVLTTGALQKLSELRSDTIGKRAIVVGAEHVSFSAVDTLTKANCRTVGILTEFERHQTYATFYWWVAGRKAVPLHTRSKIVEIRGNRRVESIELENLDTGKRNEIECDTVVFTGDWIPNNELSRLGNLRLNLNTNGPEVDHRFRTSRPGVFAAGNLLRGAEMADVVALEGRSAAREIVRYLQKADWSEEPSRIPINVVSPIRWVSPNVIDTNSQTVLPGYQFTFEVDRFLNSGTVRLVSDSGVLVGKKFRKLTPNRCHRLRLQLNSMAFNSLSIEFETSGS